MFFIFLCCIVDSFFNDIEVFFFCFDFEVLFVESVEVFEKKFFKDFLVFVFIFCIFGKFFLGVFEDVIK